MTSWLLEQKNVQNSKNLSKRYPKLTKFDRDFDQKNCYVKCFQKLKA